MKHLLKGAMLVCVVTLLLSTLSLTTAEAKANSSGSPTFRHLNSVAAVSASDVWAVGSFSKSNNSFQTLIEHWNGIKWSVVSNPNPGSISNGLDGIGAVSASDIWAVGISSNTSNSFQTLIEHWNGRNWSVVKSPNPAGTMNNFLNGIAVISASDIWAVGNSSNTNNSSQTLIEHWNGSNWSIVKSPNRASQNGLNGVAAVTANNIWAVGSSSNTSNSAQTLIEHWNGSTWGIVKSPSPGSGVVSLSDVAVVSTNNVWAAGSSNTSSTTLIEHWNGTGWSVVKSPNPGSVDLLLGIAVVSTNNIWAVGQSLAQIGQGLIEHWNGSTWSVVKSPNQPGSVSSFLSGIAVISAGDIWAVGGFQGSNNDEHTLIEHWNGTKWSIVPSP